MQETLYLIDSSAVAFRSFYAFINRPLVNSKGRETSVIFGFASHILRLINECHPTHIAIVQDLPKKTFRHHMYQEYKAHRKPIPENLITQLPDVNEFVELSGLHCISKEGFEADDVIGTLALQGKRAGMKVFIVSRDKDLMQLVDDDILMFDLGSAGEASTTMGVAEVKEKMGVPPKQIVDLLALIGDASDNVPGVAKIGPKTAADLLATYGNLENTYKNAESISKKGLRENLLKDKEMAFLSQKLVTLDCDIVLPVGLENFRYQGLDLKAINTFVENLELHSLRKFIPKENTVTSTGSVSAGVSSVNVVAAVSGGGRSTSRGSAVAGNPSLLDDSMIGTVPSTSSMSSVSGKGDSVVTESVEVTEVTEAAAKANRSHLHYQLAYGEEALDKLFQELRKADIIALDTETTGLDTNTAGLVGICLSTQSHTGWYIPIGHHAGPNLSLEEARKFLSPIFHDANKKFIFHNAKYDIPILERHDFLPSCLFLGGNLIDTMVATYVCNPGTRRLSLDDLAMDHFQHAMIPIEVLIGKGKNQKSFAEVPVDKACEYGAEDADITFRLWEIFSKELTEKNLSQLFFTMEMTLLPVLLRMEGRGITLDVNVLKTLSEQLKLEIARLENEIFTLAGQIFNVSSPLQLQEILFAKLGLKTGKKTKTGYSTDADVLGKLEGKHPIISLLLDHRECTKLRSTYVEALPEIADPVTHKIHTHYSQVIAATGRLSSINPNLQNIPIRTETGRKIRGCFVPSSPDHVLLCADYSQIELRLLAHLSGDPALCEAYQKGLDIHSRTASILYKIPEDQVTSDMRRNAKVVNFGVLYGMGPQRLSAQLKIPRAEAQQFIANYFSTYASVDRYIQDTIESGRRLGYVETLAGRKRFLPDLMSDNRMLKENAERIAANTPIQGSAADLIKIAMISIDKKIAAKGWDCAMLLQVHDELVFEVHTRDVAAASEFIREEMINAMQLRVPLTVEIGTGLTWLSAHS